MSRLPIPCINHPDVLVYTGGGRCVQCQGTSARGYGGDWSVRSKRIIARDVTCQIRLPGCQGNATAADHILAKVDGGTDDDWNLQGACRHCNTTKENQRRTARVHGPEHATRQGPRIGRLGPPLSTPSRSHGPSVG